MKHSPQLVLIRSSGEEAAQLVDVPPEQLLLRWLNYQLREAPAWQPREAATSFSADMRDGAAMLGLLESVAPDAAPAWRCPHTEWTHCCCFVHIEQQQCTYQRARAQCCVQELSARG